MGKRGEHAIAEDPSTKGRGTTLHDQPTRHGCLGPLRRWACPAAAATGSNSIQPSSCFPGDDADLWFAVCGQVTRARTHTNRPDDHNNGKFQLSVFVWSVRRSHIQLQRTEAGPVPRDRFHQICLHLFPVHLQGDENMFHQERSERQNEGERGSTTYVGVQKAGMKLGGCSGRVRRPLQMDPCPQNSGTNQWTPQTQTVSIPVEAKNIRPRNRTSSDILSPPRNKNNSTNGVSAAALRTRNTSNNSCRLPHNHQAQPRPNTRKTCGRGAQQESKGPRILRRPA